MNRLIGLIMTLGLAGYPAGARVYVAYRLAGPPMPAEPNQEFSVCAANVGSARVDVLLQLISVRTGAVVASREVTLPPPGSGVGMTDPCLTSTADALGATANPPSAGQPQVAGVVVVRKGALDFKEAAVTAGIQVTAGDAAGARKTVSYIPLQITNNDNLRIAAQ